MSKLLAGLVLVGFVGAWITAVIAWFAMIVYGFVALLLRLAIDWVTGLVARHQRRLEQEARQEEVLRRQMVATAPSPYTAPPATGRPDVVVPASGFGPPQQP